MGARSESQRGGVPAKGTLGAVPAWGSVYVGDALTDRSGARPVPGRSGTKANQRTAFWPNFPARTRCERGPFALRLRPSRLGNTPSRRLLQAAGRCKRLVKYRGLLIAPDSSFSRTTKT